MMRIAGIDYSLTSPAICIWIKEIDEITSSILNKINAVLIENIVEEPLKLNGSDNKNEDETRLLFRSKKYKNEDTKVI